MGYRMNQSQVGDRIELGAVALHSEKQWLERKRTAKARLPFDDIYLRRLRFGQRPADRNRTSLNPSNFDIWASKWLPPVRAGHWLRLSASRRTDALVLTSVPIIEG